MVVTIFQQRVLALLMRGRLFQFVAFAIAMSVCQLASAERIKDLASIAGVRSNQLLGYGLIVGLDGTGDSATQTRFTAQSLRAMLSQVRYFNSLEYNARVQKYCRGDGACRTSTLHQTWANHRYHGVVVG